MELSQIGANATEQPALSSKRDRALPRRFHATPSSLTENCCSRADLSSARLPSKQPVDGSNPSGSVARSQAGSGI